MPAPAAAFEIDLEPSWPPAARGEEVYEDLITLPAGRPRTSPSSPTRARRRDDRGTMRAAGGELSRAAIVFDLYGGEQVATGKRAWRCGSSSGLPTGP